MPAMPKVPSYLRLIDAMPDGHRFVGWFGASKVMTPNCEPQAVFWSGYDITAMGSMARFGTAEGATERLLLDMDTPERHEPDQDAMAVSGDMLRFERRAVWGPCIGYHLYRPGAMVVPCYLRVVRPLILDHDPHLSPHEIAYRGLSCEHGAILRGAGYTSAQIKEFSRSYAPEDDLASHLLAKGYDGVTYPDDVEGAGAPGWMILDPSQAWPLYGGRLTIGF
ncbi:MAG: hypothetical protein ACLGIM_16300 [Alphaproteobacteria bacterium]